jgi:hypothetical protein
MQPIDLHSLFGSITWPVIVVIVFFVFRSPWSELVGVLLYTPNATPSKLAILNPALHR